MKHITKKKAQEIVRTCLPIIHKLLELNEIKYKVYCVKHTSPKLKVRLRVNDDRYANELGLTFCDTEIITETYLFYNKHDKESEFLLTLIHELLHVAFHKFEFSESRKENHKIEENIIRGVEDLIKFYIKNPSSYFNDIEDKE